MRAAAFIFYVKSFNFNKQCFRRLVSLQKHKIRARILNLRLRDTTRLKSAIKGHKKQLLSFRLKSDILPLKKTREGGSILLAKPVSLLGFTKKGYQTRDTGCFLCPLSKILIGSCPLKNPWVFFTGQQEDLKRAACCFPHGFFLRVVALIFD